MRVGGDESQAKNNRGNWAESFSIMMEQIFIYVEGIIFLFVET
jgi:hypothetical protein